MKRNNIVKKIRGFGKFLFSLTLIPYGIATYKELKTVDWMNYWQVVRVTAFVIFFSLVVASFVFGTDQIVSHLFNFIVKKAS